MKCGLLFRVKIKDRNERLQAIDPDGFSSVFLARVSPLPSWRTLFEQVTAGNLDDGTNADRSSTQVLRTLIEPHGIN